MFNFGLHDYNQGMAGADEYESELRLIVKALRATGCKLIFAATTPCHNTAKPGDNPTVIELNRRAEVFYVCIFAPTISTRILGRRTAPYPPFLISNRVPHGFTPRS